MGKAKDAFIRAVQPKARPKPMDVLLPPPPRMPQKLFEKLDLTPFGTVMNRGRSSARGDLDRVPLVDMEKRAAADKKIEFKRAPGSNGQDFDR